MDADQLTYDPGPRLGPGRFYLNGQLLEDGDRLELGLAGGVWAPAVFVAGLVNVALADGSTASLSVPLGGPWPLRWRDKKESAA